MQTKSPYNYWSDKDPPLDRAKQIDLMTTVAERHSTFIERAIELQTNTKKD